MSHLIETLGRLVKAERAAGRGETFVLTYTGPVDREIIGHPGWHQGCDAPTNVEVDELADHGWVRITDSEVNPTLRHHGCRPRRMGPSPSENRSRDRGRSRALRRKGLMSLR